MSRPNSHCGLRANTVNEKLKISILLDYLNNIHIAKAQIVFNVAIYPSDIFTLLFHRI